MSRYFHDEALTLLLGDAVEEMRTLPTGSVDAVVTSPPYFGLRDYAGHSEQLGLEKSPAAYVARLVEVFDEARRVLAEDGTLWLNLGDSYSSGSSGQSGMAALGERYRGGGLTDAVAKQRRTVVAELPPKNLLGIPWRMAFALQDTGWILRNAIVWSKPNAMPESVRDRLSTRYEFVFLFSQTRRYWFDLDAVREKQDTAGERHAGRSCGSGAGWPTPWTAQQRALNPRRKNPGDVWTISTTPLPDAHFAAFPVELPRRCILAGCRPGGTVLDPFSGAGTTLLAAQQVGRRAIGIDLVAQYHDIALRRMQDAPLPLVDGEVPA